jgi:hypothetical protein
MAAARLLPLLVVVTAIATAIASAGHTSTAGPPPGLTPYGQIVWNLDALVNDTFGRRRPCVDLNRGNVFSVPQSRFCPAPLARYSDYTFTFLNAFHSRYRLVKRSNPWAGTNAAPFTIAGRAVYCGGGLWVGMFHGGGYWQFGCQRP